MKKLWSTLNFYPYLFEQISTPLSKFCWKLSSLSIQLVLDIWHYSIQIEFVYFYNFSCSAYLKGLNVVSIYFFHNILFLSYSKCDLCLRIIHLWLSSSDSTIQNRFLSRLKSEQQIVFFDLWKLRLKYMYKSWCIWNVFSCSDFSFFLVFIYRLLNFVTSTYIRLLRYGFQTISSVGFRIDVFQEHFKMYEKVRNEFIRR